MTSLIITLTNSKGILRVYYLKGVSDKGAKKTKTTKGNSFLPIPSS